MVSRRHKAWQIHSRESSKTVLARLVLHTALRGAHHFQIVFELSIQQAKENSEIKIVPTQICSITD